MSNTEMEKAIEDAVNELKQKQVSEYCIKKGMKEIDEDDYLKTLHKLATEKWTSVTAEKNVFIKLRKTQDYLMQKGYEHDLIRRVVKVIDRRLVGSQSVLAIREHRVELIQKLSRSHAKIMGTL